MKGWDFAVLTCFRCQIKTECAYTSVGSSRIALCVYCLRTLATLAAEKPEKPLKSPDLGLMAQLRLSVAMKGGDR